ncbi:MAG: HAD family hydrolase [Pedosphaera sp.]|nr:HAD family hydrolase [Pedosphaera sp.]
MNARFASAAAVFLDRDGTLIVDKSYLSKPEEVEFIPGTMEGLKKLVSAGFRLVMVTNQSGVGRGYFTLADVEKVHARMAVELKSMGVLLEAVYVAPEAPDQPSCGRKPSPQFLFDARDGLGLDLDRCYVVGDKWLDLETGWNAGTRRSLLVRTGHGRQVEAENRGNMRGAVVVDDMGAAAEWILRDAKNGVKNEVKTGSSETIGSCAPKA